MARKGKQAVRNGGLPAWLLVLIGIVIGGIGMWFILRSGHMPISRPDTPLAPQTGESSADAGIAAKPQTVPSKYDFYSVLPEKEVVIPDAQLASEARAEQQAGASTASPTPRAEQVTQAPAASGQGSYLLLVGSFTTDASAEARKAKLALKGLRARVEPVTIDGRTLHRVLLGPYATATALEADKKTLAADGVHAIAMKEH